MKLSRIVLIFTGLAMAGCARDDVNNGTGNGNDDTGDGNGVTPLTTDLALRDEMRGLWTEHVAWTRFYLMDTIAELPSAPAATDRLLRNQSDIGDAIRPFYGDAAGDQLTELLEEHVVGADTLVKAAMAGDADAVAAADATWHANADEIAAFLAGANPAWDEQVLAAHMHEHLDLTLGEATARLTRDWQADVAAYDRLQVKILDLSNELSAGIETQFPELVERSDVPEEDQAVHVAMRKLWEDHVIWTRVFLISDIGELRDTREMTSRLLLNQAHIGRAVEPFFGQQAADELTLLLEEHILTAAALLHAAEAGNATVSAAATVAWYDNAHEIAAFLAEANPAWGEADLTAMLDMHLDLTLNEAAARLTGDWDADVAAFDEVEVEMRTMSDAFTDGLTAYVSGDLGEPGDEGAGERW